MLSNIGLHAGNIKVEEEPKLSQGCYKVPRKEFFGGIKATSFLGFSIKDANREENENLFNKWKWLHRVVKDKVGGRAIQNHKANVWKSLGRILYYVEQHYWDEIKVISFYKALLDWKAYLVG